MLAELWGSSCADLGIRLLQPVWLVLLPLAPSILCFLLLWVERAHPSGLSCGSDLWGSACGQREGQAGSPRGEPAPPWVPCEAKSRPHHRRRRQEGPQAGWWVGQASEQVLGRAAGFPRARAGHQHPGQQRDPAYSNRAKLPLFVLTWGPRTGLSWVVLHSVALASLGRRRSRRGPPGPAASLQRWDAGSIPGSAEREKDLAWPQLWCRSQLPLESDLIPGPGTPHAAGQLKRRRKMEPLRTGDREPALHPSLCPAEGPWARGRDVKRLQLRAGVGVLSLGTWRMAVPGAALPPPCVSLISPPTPVSEFRRSCDSLS